VSRIRILHVTPYFAPAWAYGGPPRSIYELCLELLRRGHDVSVVTTDALGRDRRVLLQEEDVQGIRTYRFPNLSSRLAWDRQLFLPSGTWRFLKKHRKEFDLIHLHMYRTLQDILVHRLAARYGTPYVFAARGSLLRIVRQARTKALFDALFGNHLLRDARRLIALSKTEKGHYESMGVPSEKVSVVFNGIDADRFQNLPARGALARELGLEDRQVIAYLGRLNPRKGLDLLLHAFAEVHRRKRDAVLVFAGPDEGCQRRLETLAGTLAVKDSVAFIGLVIGEKRLQLLADADVIVYPGYHEVFGMVPFEALACGKPVIVSDDSGCGEIVRQARAGVTVPFGDHVAWAEAIVTVLDNGREIREMIGRGREFVQERLNWRSIGDEMETVYRIAAAAN